MKNEYSKIAKENQLSGLNNQSSFDQNLSNDSIETSKKIADDLDMGSGRNSVLYTNYNMNITSIIKHIVRG